MSSLKIQNMPLRIPVGTEKIPTGGFGDYSISVNYIADYTFTYKDLTTQSYVDTQVGAVTTALNTHTARVDNPHQVTKDQVGLGNVDNTSDINKPISSATQTALTNLNTTLTASISVKANKSEVYEKSEVYNKSEVYEKSEVYTKLESDGKYHQKLSIDGILAPTSVFDDVKNLDGVNGTPDSIINQPIQNLANRTEFLKTHNNLSGRDSLNAHPASSILDVGGQTQQQVNYNGGSKWYSRVGGYKLNERVVLTNGDIVKSTVDGNVNNPNVNMTGWEYSSLIPSKNLNDVPDKAAARTNLGVYSKAETDAKFVTDELLYMPIPYPKSTPPSGYLAMMGQAISQATYPKLYALYGAVLPDMRAYSVRGLDYGRGIDVGRTVLSQQGDAIRNITGSIEFGFFDTVSSSGAYQVTTQTSSSGGGVNGYPKRSVDFDASRVVPVAAENRIKNIAFLYIVKAG